MRPNPIRGLLNAGKPIINAWLSIPSTYLAEGAGHQGFDSITVDLQHGMLGFETTVGMLQAISATPAVPMVRAPSNAAADIMHLLDAGAYGIICPLISNADDTAKFVAACRYPPAGNRSFGPARGKLYGGTNYFEKANDEILAIPMIETAEALENIDEILAVPGVDMIYIGPNDLALDLGERPGADATASRTSDAIAHLIARAKSADIPLGIFCNDAETAMSRIREGIDLVTPGNDFAILTNAMQAAVSKIRYTSE